MNVLAHCESSYTSTAIPHFTFRLPSHIKPAMAHTFRPQCPCTCGKLWSTTAEHADSRLVKCDACAHHQEWWWWNGNFKWKRV